MMWSPKNLKQALIPIVGLNWLSGLGLVEYPVGNSRRNLNLIFVLLIVSSFWFANVIFELDSCANADVHSLDVMLFTMLRYFNTLTASLSLIIGWYSRQKMQFCMERVELMDEAFESLGKGKKYRNIFIQSLIISIFWLALMCNVYIADVYLHLSEMDLIKSMMCVFCFQWPIHINTVVDVTFISALSSLGSRFKNINCLLQGKSEHPQNKLFKILKKSRKISVFVKPSNIEPTTIKISSIEMYKHFHLELSEITAEINKIYETQITLEMATNFVSITAFLYYFKNAFNLPASSLEVKMKNMLPLTLWGMIYFLRFLNLNIASERIYIEANKTRQIVFKRKEFNAEVNVELVEQTEQFSLQLAQNPLLIKIHGFSTLGKTFIIDFLGKVMTYLVILIQMRSES